MSRPTSNQLVLHSPSSLEPSPPAWQRDDDRAIKVTLAPLISLTPVKLSNTLLKKSTKIVVSFYNDLIYILFYFFHFKR